MRLLYKYLLGEGEVVPYSDSFYNPCSDDNDAKEFPELTGEIGVGVQEDRTS